MARFKASPTPLGGDLQALAGHVERELQRLGSQPWDGVPFIARTQAEIAASVTPVNYAYDPTGPGMLKRYGAKVDGSTDDTDAWNRALSVASASGGPAYIFVPYGTSIFSSQLSIPANVTLLGLSRAGCVMKFTGTPSGSPANTRSALRYTSGVVNSSGYANVYFRDFTIWVANAVNFGAAIEISAGGYSYFGVSNIWIKGSCSYGVILDAVEICTVERCLIENTNATANANIWITNGADRSSGQDVGFSNLITIRENQISGGAGSVGVVDDGGNEHVIQGNNFNQHSTPMRISGVTGLHTGGNSYETTLQTGSANVLLASVTNSGAVVGPCAGGKISADGFYGNMSSGSLLTFSGSLNTITGISKASSAVITVSTAGSANPFVVNAPVFVTGVSGMTEINGKVGTVSAIGGSSGAWTATVNIDSSGFTAYSSGGQAQMMHSGFVVEGCNFGNQLGRGSAIDVTFLANSVCWANNDYAATGGASHYAGAHNDECGNFLMPPQNGFAGGSGVGISGPTFGDTRYASIFSKGITSNAVVKVPGGSTAVLSALSSITTGAGTSTGTLTNAPAAGNPTKWIPIDDNGTTRYIPSW